jgi:bifunctional non-homologous end joining protein LigD
MPVAGAPEAAEDQKGREASLARLLKRRADGIFIAEYEQGDIGDVLFRVACNMGLL